MKRSLDGVRAWLPGLRGVRSVRGVRGGVPAPRGGVWPVFTRFAAGLRGVPGVAASIMSMGPAPFVNSMRTSGGLAMEGCAEGYHVTMSDAEGSGRRFRCFGAATLSSMLPPPLLKVWQRDATSRRLHRPFGDLRGPPHATSDVGRAARRARRRERDGLRRAGRETRPHRRRDGLAQGAPLRRRRPHPALRQARATPAPSKRTRAPSPEHRRSSTSRRPRRRPRRPRRPPRPRRPGRPRRRRPRRRRRRRGGAASRRRRRAARRRGSRASSRISWRTLPTAAR